MAVEIQIPNSSGSGSPLWTYSSPGGTVPVQPPVVEIDGRSVVLAPTLVSKGVKKVNDTIKEHTYTGTTNGLTLSLIARTADASPIVRFRYELKSEDRKLLTKTNGEKFQLAQVPVTSGATEIRLSDFSSMVHSYVPTEVTLTQADFDHSRPIMGPIVVLPNSDGNTLLAYEHGSQYPDAYLHFFPKSDSISLTGAKATYLHGTNLQNGFQTVWMHLGATRGERGTLEAAYRDFIHYYQAVRPESRAPYIFYNTWGYQERVHFWEQRPYLEDLTEERMLAEIEVAHKLGLEVFVLDTGWYDATGDWRVSSARFPNGLKPLKEKLDSYGMKLGLWFGPTTASLSSNLYKNNVKNKVSWKGKLAPTRMIWETEESAEFCLASSYAKDFAQELIRCAKELGVRYFKWDAVNQYGCDNPNHDHGDESHSQQERADRYAFLQPLAMCDIVEELCAAVPDAIVDFDVTEYDRCFGLAFLSVGKYFILNSGPYFHNYDVPRTKDVSFRNNSLFFYPGPARDWIMRTPYAFDKWIPSVLFLAHYLPDDPPTNQNMTAGSLILGHHGIWGDLVGISPSGVDYLGGLLAPYKKIREDAASVAFVQTGEPGCMIESYEKINPATGKGLMVIFGNVTMQSAWGKPLTMREPLVADIITTTKPAQAIWKTPNVEVKFDEQGRAVLKTNFNGSDAAIVYFGVH